MYLPPFLPTAYPAQSVLILHTVNIQKTDRMGEGEPAPAPAADIKIFISGNSGSKEVKRAKLVELTLFKR